MYSSTHAYLSAKWRRVVHAPAALPLGKKTGVHGLRGWWAPEIMRTYNFNLCGPG